MPWYWAILTKVWKYLTFPEKDKPKERIAILVVSVVTAGVAYFFVIDALAPSRNVIRRLSNMAGLNSYEIFSGKQGGVYIKIGDVIQESTEVANRPLGENESAADNVGRVLKQPLSFGLCQEDVLIKSGLEPGALRIVGPLYDERLHVLYRKSKLETAPRLNMKPERALRALFESAKIRVSSKDPKPGELGVAQQILNLCGLTPAKYVKGGFRDALTRLQVKEDADDAIDVAFMMAGTPLPELENTTALTTADGDLRLMEIDYDVIRALNDTLGLKYIPASLSNIYGSYSGGGQTLGIRAMLIASKDVPSSVIREVALAVVDKRDSGRIPVDSDTFGTLQYVIDTYPSIWEERLQTWLLSLGILTAILVSVYLMLNWVLSSFKEIGYSRSLTSIYNQLPSNDSLVRKEGALPIPRKLANNFEITSGLIEGISKLLALKMRIRNDYETGGLTSHHQAYLTNSIDSIKAVFLGHLGRRLSTFVKQTPSLKEVDLHRLYTAGYLNREDYQDLLEAHRRREVKPSVKSTG